MIPASGCPFGQSSPCFSLKGWQEEHPSRPSPQASPFPALSLRASMMSSRGELIGAALRRPEVCASTDDSSGHRSAVCIVPWYVNRHTLYRAQPSHSRMWHSHLWGQPGAWNVYLSCFLAHAGVTAFLHPLSFCWF